VRGHMWFRPFAGVLLLVYAAACYHYAATDELGPEAYIAQKEPGQVRITLTDSSQTIVYNPWITSDSVGGHVGRSSQRQPWSAPRERVTKIEAHRMKVVATVFAVGIPVVLIGGLIAVATACEDGCAGIGSY